MRYKNRYVSYINKLIIHPALIKSVIQKYHPQYINTQFNHPNEITKESKKVCEMLADAGIPLGNQLV